LKKPENMMIGNKNIGRTVLTDLESWIIDPNSNPTEVPAKHVRKSTK
jgi:hypothetical protein